MRFLFLFFTAFLLQSCQTNEWQPNGGLDKTDTALFASWQKLDAAFNCCSNEVWTSDYRPQNEPILFVRTNGGKFSHAYLINHPAPNAVAGAVRINASALSNLPPIYRLNQLSPEQLEFIGNFDFEFPIGGSDVFAVTYQKRSASKVRKALESENIYQEPGQSSFADVASDDWILFLAHEIFHRRQFKLWAQFENDQDLDRYNFSQENIAMILLEQEILTNGLRRRTKEAAQTALVEYAAIRQYRQARFGLQVKTLDSAQEIYEGTSRYIEHRFGEILGNSEFNMNNFAEIIENDQELFRESNVREQIGFGRFYASGAGVAALLDRADIEWKNTIRFGQNFNDIIRDNFVLQDERNIISSIRTRYDYNALFNHAAELSALANQEL